MVRAPGLRQWIPLPYGPFGDFLHDPLIFQMRARDRFGDIFRFRMGPLLVHFLHHPDHVRRVFHDNPKNYQRGWQYRILRRLFGDSLLVSEGDFWLRQRRLAQPAFHRQRLAGYANVMVDATARMLSSWCAEGVSEITVEIGREMSRLALAIASRTLFDRDVSHEADSVGKAFAVVSQYLEHRFNRPFTTLPLWCPTPGNRRFKEAARTLNELVMDLVRERRSEGRDHGDLLSMLMSARDEESGASMTDDQLRSEVLTFLMAGHETTATALTWTWYLLATHPAIQQRVRDEVVRVLGDRSPTLADLPQLDATRMVLEESMRLYPPVWAVPRQVVADDDIGGFRVPRGSTVLLCQFVTHRHPDFWEKPDVFNPDRFAPERTATRPKGVYFPFLGGAHQCIGNEFAMLEMRLIVALMLQKFELELLPDQEIRPQASIALRPSGPVQLALRRLKD